MSKRIVVLISGNGSNLQAIIDATDSGAIPGAVVGVLSNKADAYGLERAAQHNIPTYVLNHREFTDRAQYDQALMARIDSLEADLIVLAGFMRILTPEFVEHYQGRLINIHPSLLPKFKGLNTHQRAIESGEKVHGCSVHFVTAELDGGPVIVQASVPITAGMDADELASRVHEQEHKIYPLAVSWFCAARLELVDNRVVLDGTPLPTQGADFNSV